jgi:hypothetical protein
MKKYIVCDEFGPIRVFPSKEEAEHFLQEGFSLIVEKVPMTRIDFSKFEEALF